jgi:hypothetical protein
MNEPTLEAALAAWAQGVRLSASDADIIRSRIVMWPEPRASMRSRQHGTGPGHLSEQGTPPPNLPDTWWQALAVQVSDVVVRATNLAVPVHSFERSLA